MEIKTGLVYNIYHIILLDPPSFRNCFLNTIPRSRDWSLEGQMRSFNNCFLLFLELSTLLYRSMHVLKHSWSKSQELVNTVSWSRSYSDYRGEGEALFKFKSINHSFDDQDIILFCSSFQNSEGAKCPPYPLFMVSLCDTL